MAIVNLLGIHVLAELADHHAVRDEGGRANWRSHLWFSGSSRQKGP